MKEQELTALLQEMSPEEKAEQLMQLRGTFYQKDAVAIVTGPDGEALGLTREMLQNAGSVLSIYGARQLADLQKRYMASQPHHIPLLFMMDVIHGMKTIFPIPLGLAASFDPELMERCAAAAALEAAVSGIHVVFSPMTDLVRDSRWGRVMESTGEDPWLNEQYARAQVRGYQGDDMSEPGKVCACVKHFAAYGAVEAGREYHYSQVDTYTLMDRYMSAYHAGIKAGAGMVMTSFGAVGGVPCSINRWLLRDVLREQFRFDGVVISDYSAIEETITGGCCRDKKEAAQKALEAGVDIDMMTGVYAGCLPQLISEGAVQERLIDESVMRVLKLKNRLGLFENPYKDADPEKEKEVVLCHKHRNLAREAAQRSFVLLKNDGLLPLKKEEKIAFIGPYADRKEMLSNWAVAGDSCDCVTVREAAEEVWEEGRAVFCPGCTMFSREELTGAFEVSPKDAGTKEELAVMREEAVEAAKWADTVVLFLGEHFRQSGEAASRAALGLPEAQMRLLREIWRVNDRIVLVLFNGRPLELREPEQLSKSILEVWLPGTEGGHAVMDVLTGKESPSGKLTMSFPRGVGQLPMSYNEYRTGRPAELTEYGRFCSRYVDMPNDPLYPFGFGLTYTRFRLSPVRMDRTTVTSDRSAYASVSVENVGKREGTATIQLYIGDLTASAVRPVKELKGFLRVSLKAGQKETVEFEITEEMLRFYHSETGMMQSEEGEFLLWIGEDSRTENKVKFCLQK